MSPNHSNQILLDVGLRAHCAKPTYWAM